MLGENPLSARLDLHEDAGIFPSGNRFFPIDRTGVIA